MTGSVYAGRHIALLTQHGKEAVIAPVLDAARGCRVERVSGFDTDTLGTFTRDIPRSGTQLEAARRKARIGMELSGLPLGLASEGAFGPDPMAGLFPWDVELLLFIDDARGIEVTGMAQQVTRFAHLLTDDWGAAEQFARQADFPEHHLVVRPQAEDDPRIEKGLDTWAALEAAFHRAREQAANDRMFLDNDVRAHAHPTRRAVIRLAAGDLAGKLVQRCRVCGTPGFGLVERRIDFLAQTAARPRGKYMRPFTAASNAFIAKCVNEPTRNMPIRGAVIFATREANVELTPFDLRKMQGMPNFLRFR